MSGGPAPDYKPVIGLEIHVQLSTATKMFCGDVVEYGAAPNTHVCPVCLGLPGALPVVNARAVELAVRAALALECTIHETSVFARKNYFYPDLPKGYQITQYDRPLATDGRLSLPGPGAGQGTVGGGADAARSATEHLAVRIRRVHLEEDAGKSLHDRVPGRTAIDLNRAGVPLIEIVTEPDLWSPGEARSFLGALKRVLEYLDVSDCDMEKGSLRVDANLSVRAQGGEPGSPTEIKNLNSFSNVERALQYEAERQARALREGTVIERETRLWDAAAGTTRPMRSKEEAHDYRYFPEPDLPPLVLENGVVEAIRATLPELPHQRQARLVAEYGIPDYDAGVLTADRPVADYFESLAAAAGEPKAASNWVMGEVRAWLNETGSSMDAFPITPARLADLIRLVGDGTLSSTGARDVFGIMTEDPRPAAEIVEAEGMARVADRGQLAAWVDAVLMAHPEERARLEAGELQLVGFFVGRVMQQSRGTADPERVASLLRDRASASHD